MTNSNNKEQKSNANQLSNFNENIGNTQVLYGIDNVINTELQFFSKTRGKIDTCMNYTRPPLAIEIDTVKKAFVDAKNRGVKLRYLTEITSENIAYCKELMSIVDELRHLEGIKGNFMLSESQYLSPVVLFEKEKVASQIICSNLKVIIEQQQYIFDSFWDRSIPAYQRILGIESGIESEFIEVISDNKKAAEIYIDLAKSVEKEALLLFANAKAIIRADRLGVLDSLINASNNKGALVRIISPITAENSQIVEKICARAPGIKILNGGSSHSGQMLIDNTKFLRFGIKEPKAEEFSGAIRFVEYSNSKVGVYSSRAFFELLWNELFQHEQLKRHDKMQKEFINIAAHELRNPIQPIIGLSEVLRSRIKNADEHEFLDVIIRSAKRLQQLTDNILNLAQIENHSLKLNKERFDLSALIANILKDYRNQLAGKNDINNGNDKGNGKVKLLYTNRRGKGDYGSNDDIIFVEADAGRIIQVISNLLNNAIKFTNIEVGEEATKDNTITIMVDHDENKDNNSVVVSVEDTGRGIDPEILPKLFSKFVTNSESGTGLGLFISKNIIEAHGGKMWAGNNRDNNDGKRIGATFRFSLPVSKENRTILKTDICNKSDVNELGNIACI
jgi:two-component system, OmpR family, sensor histidine kinase VicK